METLKSSEEFNLVYKNGFRFVGKCFLMYVFEPSMSSCISRKKSIESIFDSLSHNRSFIGLSVSKKNGNAVERNRIKRIFRSIYRRNSDIFSGYAIVLVARDGILDLEYKSLEASIIKGIGRVCSRARGF